MAAFWRQERRSLRFIEKEKKRIVDYLHEPDGGGGAGGGDEEMDAGNRKNGDLSLLLALSASPSNASLAGGSSYSPRSLLSRWLLPLQKSSPGGRSGGGGGGGGGEVVSGSGRLVRFLGYFREKKKKKKREEEEVGPSVSEVVEGDGAGHRGTSKKLSVSSDEKPEEISLNLGMGLGLVFLLTRCATEFKRMTEMQAEMETLLKEIKNEVQRNNVICSFLETSNDATFPGPDCSGDVSTGKAIPSLSDIASFKQEEARCAIESNVQSNYVAISDNKSYLKMDQLEAELEIELERLQLNLEGEDSSVLRGQHKMELASESHDSSESFSFSFGQNVEPKNEDIGEFSGVPALDLERRLHELLHARQQEQIAELEYALECTKRKLVDKEIELCSLRDSACFTSQG
ncbi:protein POLARALIZATION DURING ASYMMETRIC DIVISION AND REDISTRIBUTION [Elaeis guineensis]|uniref:Protein POLAR LOCALIZATION DURING ASYMMETRIC DIVISION AND REDISTRIBUTION-like n=1 Tax=Elaeis guineensis var. tenera TaxID=51953 RepID=A0A8N4IC10_ELAGV|nr:protein POLAR LOCALIZATION DURING ASYMMETRIC DIVISION AND REDISTRIBUTION-like [Elaeis guineensis]